MEDDYLTIEEAADFLRVETAVLDKFIKANIATINQRTIGGLRRFLLADLKEKQDEDPTFGGLKAVSEKLITPISALEASLLHRRRFVFGTATLTASFASGVAGRTRGNIVADEIEKNIEIHRNADEARHLFRVYFGQNDFSYDLGDKYPYGGYHRDHYRAFEGVKGVSHGVIEASRSAALIRPPNDDHLVVGGPISTPSVRALWQYESGRLGGHSLQRVRAPLLQLPYSFLIDDKDERMKGMERVSWTFADGSASLADSRNRLLLDQRRPMFSLRPEISRDEFNLINGETVYLPRENYLIITRLPNFLSEKFDGQNQNLWGRLVVIQATNGIGTRAVDLFLSDKGKDPLLKMAADVGHAQAFQAIFRVSKPKKDLRHIDNFTCIEYVESAVVGDEIKSNDYSKLRNIIRKTKGYSRYL